MCNRVPGRLRAQPPFVESYGLVTVRCCPTTVKDFFDLFKWLSIGELSNLNVIVENILIAPASSHGNVKFSFYVIFMIYMRCTCVFDWALVLLYMREVNYQFYPRKQIFFHQFLHIFTVMPNSEILLNSVQHTYNPAKNNWTPK